MKFLFMAFVFAVAWVVWRRSQARPPTPRSKRPGNRFSKDEHAINVRSADSVRLLSDEQVDAVERKE